VVGAFYRPPAMRGIRREAVTGEVEFNSVGYGVRRGSDNAAPFLEGERTGRCLGFDFPWCRRKDGGLAR
jgi:hypothetical protein